MNVEELQSQSVVPNFLNMESGGQIARRAIQWNIIIVHHPEIPLGVQPVEVFAINVDAVCDNLFRVFKGQKRGQFVSETVRVRIGGSIVFNP